MTTNYKKHAIIIGISLLLMAILAGYTYGFVFKGFMAFGDQNFFYNAPSNAKRLFLSGIIGWFFIFLLDLLVSWFLCHYYRRVHQSLSKINSGIRIIYSIILGIAVFILSQQLGIFTSELSTSEKVETIQTALLSFEKIWSYGLIVFGLHLMVWGILNLKAHFIPKIWGVLLIVGGLSYTIIHSIKSFSLFSTEFISTMELYLMAPMALSELGFAIWILIKKNV